MPRLAGELVRVGRVAQVLRDVVEHEVDERVEPLQRARHLPPARELDAHRLLDPLLDVEHGVLRLAALGRHGRRARFFGPSARRWARCRAADSLRRCYPLRAPGRLVLTAPARNAAACSALASLAGAGSARSRRALGCTALAGSRKEEIAHCLLF